MRKLAVVALVLALVFGTALFAAVPARASENGGMTCAGCTLVVALINQTAEINGRTITQQVEALCSWLPGDIGKVCTDVAAIVFPLIQPIWEDLGGDADLLCNVLTLCKDETAVCRLFPLPSAARTEGEYRAMLGAARAKHGGRVAASDLPRIDFESLVCGRAPALCRYLAKLGVGAAPLPHLPSFDLDGDRFSDTATMRGFDWRGKDCNDLDASVFPGRSSSDETEDANCNGIYGVDSATGQAYETEWCDGTGAMGIALLGDSATAHFRIPTNYVTAADWNSTTFQNVVMLLENEGDWPMLSWGTGFANPAQYAPDIHGPMQSLYNLLRTQNQCNANDYQNIGVNGARTANLREWAMMLNRNATPTAAVKPLMLFMSMIGNDVCGSNPDPSSMTTPAEYFANIVAAILTADSFLPAGSRIILVPLVDGRILFDTMGNRIHPIGSTNQDVTYSQFYDYLNCLDASPCAGWMNSNASVRNATFAVANSLNEQLPLIVNATKSMGLKNVEVFYPGNVINEFLTSFTGPRYELIEPVDGFHPSQLGNSLISQAYWWALGNASLLPPVNPNNAAILAKFGERRP